VGHADASYPLLLVGKAMAPNSDVVFPPGHRVAMVVTKAPSEPWSMVRRTLTAMLQQSYQHDTWLADEDPSPETEAWCAAHDVRISCRRGRADYHRTEWPRRTRCKEGNLAFFFDHFGYESYEFVSQLDADHVPEPGYLEEMLRPFVDPSVGYVSAPSICNNNRGQELGGAKPAVCGGPAARRTAIGL
jgi:cellulose synthase (UDP-forming)